MLKPAIIALALLTATSPALAKAQKLPFVGTKCFNFLGGNATTEFITITKKGNYIIRTHFGEEMEDVVYKGQYRNPIPINDSRYGRKFYYKIKGDQILILDKNKKLDYGCTGDQACITSLWGCNDL